MDSSITILATASTLSNVLHALNITIASTVELRRQWQDALLLENQLSTLRTALGQMRDWTEQSSSSRPGILNLHPQLVVDLDRCIACCRLLITKIDTDVAQLQNITVGDRLKFTRFLKMRNLKNTQTMVQQQTAALTLLLTACNSASISQQRELLEKPQTRSVFAAMEDDTTSLFTNRNSGTHLAPSPSTSSSSSSSSTLSSTSIFRGLSKRSSSKSDSDRPQLLTKISERREPRPEPKSRGKRPATAADVEAWDRATSSSGSVEASDKFIVDDNTMYRVETRDKFSVLPTISPDDKFLVDQTTDTPVETREKFIVDSSDRPVETREKFINTLEDTTEKLTLDPSAPTPVETRDKFIVDEMAESPSSSLFEDDPRVMSNLGGLLRNTSSPIKEKWKPLRLISPVREKHDFSRRRSLAIDNALREEHKKGQQHHYKGLLLGSKSKLHIMAASKMGDKKKKEHTDEERRKYRQVILKSVRKCTHILIREIRRVEMELEARYIWAYVDLLEGYYDDENDDNWSGPVEELDDRFFDALEGLLQNPLIARLVKKSCAEQDGIFPRSAEYFFDAISRISSPEYVPLDLDILYATGFSSTVGGINIAELRKGELQVDLIDIGGMTGKRHKWIHHFEAARFVVFVVDLEDCEEEEKMSETMQLLLSVINSKWFSEVSIVLLLNSDGSNSSDTGSTGGSSNSNVVKAASDILAEFKKITYDMDRVFILPCHIAEDGGGAAVQLILSTVKEAILTESLRESKLLM